MDLLYIFEIRIVFQINLLKIMMLNQTACTSKLSFVFICFLFLSACNSSKTDDTDITEDDTAAVVRDSAALNTENIFYSIPSPLETASLLQKAGAKYNKEYLNPVQNLSKYTTVSGQSLNLGVYGADLSFTGIFDQPQESMLYLKCANSLAESLGISGAFGESTAAQIEANMNNRDTLLKIISDAFWAADAYLKESQRPGTSSLIVTGGWVEGLYIATRVVGSTQNNEVITRIAEQKLSLDNLISLLENYKDNQSAKEILNDLKDLKKVFDGITITTSKTKVETNAETGVTTIDNNSSVSMSKDQLKAISEKVEKLRTKIINQ